MEQNINRIEELKSQIKDNNAELKQIYQALGENFIDEKLDTGDDKDLADLVQKVVNHNDQLTAIDSRMDDLRSSYNRISEIADREKKIGEEYSLLEKECRKLYTSIGKVTFLELKEKGGENPGKIYDILVEAENKLTELEEEIFRLDSQGTRKSFLTGLKDKSRSAMLKSRRKNSISSMDNHYGKLAEKIISKDPSFLEKLSDDSVTAYFVKRKELDALDMEVASLKEENSSIEKHLKSQFSSNRRKKSEEKLQAERDLALSDKMSGLTDLGSYLFDKNIHSEHKSLTELYNSAQELGKKTEKINEEIEVCKAEIKIEKLEAEIAEMKKNIQELEITIEKCNGDISEFNTEIKSARAEIRKLKKKTVKSAEETES